MKTPVISDWVDALERVHVIVAATETAQADRSVGEALTTLGGITSGCAAQRSAAP